MLVYVFFFFFSSRRRHTRWNCDWSSDVCSSDLEVGALRRVGQRDGPADVAAGPGDERRLALQISSAIVHAVPLRCLASHRTSRGWGPAVRGEPLKGEFMRIHNLYTDANGQSHFRDIEVEWVEEGKAGKLSKRLPATGIIFRQVQPSYDLDWHPAPRRQYIINLDAGVQITAGDGEARVIGAGEVILVEDTTGKGHLSKAVDGKIRHCIFVPIDN